jgi:hypothetical protein
MIGDGVCGLFIPERGVVGSGGANGRDSDLTGRVESQQVVEGRGTYMSSAGVITVVY